MATPREHIEQIRREKFSIGREENPLVEDLHHAVKHLSAELYTKDVHFLMELIQNAEDNDYEVEVEPSAEFVITNRDITGVGAPATLLVFNNEKGFTSKNIESLCSVGRSTKKGKRQGGDYIGEKGIGFKSVFLVSKHPYIFSNGYQIRFNEMPPPDTKIGYIVPEWVDGKPNVQDILNVYGGKSTAELPNTVIILPLRHEKVEAVKKQLASVHPEVILFLSKIKRFSVREENQKRVSSISVSKETAFRSIKNEQCESFILHLSAQENDKSNAECSYYMWRQRFPVKTENRVEGREEVDNWVITLAFPRDERVTTARNKLSAGIYAFLPTEMVTGLPFIIQADFMLVSSRESIRWDNKWNQGILDCVPVAFCAAFVFLVKSVESAPPSSKSYCFDKYLPIRRVSYPQLESIRQAIQIRLKTEEIILCEGQKTYCSPTQARRILPAFRKILQKSTKDQVFVIHLCMDSLQSLIFLGVQYVSFEWYSHFITSDVTWVRGLSEDVYVQLLCFVAQHWHVRAIYVKLHPFPLLKYHNDSCSNAVDLMSLTQIASSYQHRIYFSQNMKDAEWLRRWNRELGGATCRKFMPKATQMAITKLEVSQRATLLDWLNRYAKITDLSLSAFIKEIVEQVYFSRSKEFVVRVAQFLYFSTANNYIDSTEMEVLCSKLPIVNESGSIVRNAQTKLVPAAIGKWAKLMGNNRWAAQEAVILSADYLSPPPYALELAGGSLNDLALLVTSGLNGKDIPYLKPPNGQVPGFPFLIGLEEAILLLCWIQHLLHTSSSSLPIEFKTSIMKEKWLKTSRGYQSPNMCFLLNDEWSQAGLLSTDLSFFIPSLYGTSMGVFNDALEYIGVVAKFGEGCEVVAKHLQMHTDFEAITRLYKYLSRFQWTPNDKDSVKIWIPHGDRADGGEWKDAEMCIIRGDGLLNHKLNVLENIYEASLLPFFYFNLGVPVRPTAEKYCNVWLDWSSANHQGLLQYVAETECCSVWKGILKNWLLSPSKVETIMGAKGLKLPTQKINGDLLKLSPATAVFVPNDLKLTELFKRTSASTIFAWHPNPSNSEIPLHSLFSLYNSLGVKNISEVVHKTEISISKDASLRKLERGEGFFREGLYRIVLSYLAYPSFNISADKRHRIVKTLIGSPAYEITETMTISYSLTLKTEDGNPKNIVANGPSFVRWEKHNNRILIQISDRHNPKVRLSLATEFAEVLSKVLLLKHPDLVAGLLEILKIGCILKFDSEAVDDLLQEKNMQLFKEDEHFLLLQGFPRFSSPVI